MAIKRCPYCRSIIDEVDRYCNNCGTQLLFPEDEGIEEEIPGERLLEVDEKLPEESFDLPSSKRIDKTPPETSFEMDDVPFAPAKPKGEIEIPDLELPPRKPRWEPEIPRDPSPAKLATRDLPEMGVEPPPAPPSPVRMERSETKAEKPKPTGDFESGFPTSDEERNDISRLMAKWDKQPPLEEPAESPDFEVPTFSEKDLSPLRFEEEKPQTPDELPPWAERVRDGVTPGFRSTSPSDSTGVEATADPYEFRRPAASEVRPGLRPRRRKRGILAKLKARLYDVLLITLMWAAALWASSRVLSVPLFSIFENSGLQIGIFYVILFAGYFALFYYFLGETLGDRLSSPSS